MTDKYPIQKSLFTKNTTNEGTHFVEISGSIKWFDAGKGYGFIVGDSPSNQDVLLHISVLKRDGIENISQGARVFCLAEQGSRGLQCVKIISIDLSYAIHPAERPARTHAVVNIESGLERAIVKWFNRTKGFGFLTRGENTEDIFVHMETMRQYGITDLRPGQVVLVRYGKGNKGLMAGEIHPDCPVPFNMH